MTQPRLPLVAEAGAAWLLAGSILMLIGVPVGLAIGNDIMIGFGGALGGSGLLIALLMRHANRRNRRHLDATASGDCLARWTYSDAQWAQHVADSHARRDRILRRGLGVGALVGCVTAAVAGVANLFIGAIPSEDIWLPLAVMFGLGLGMMTLIGAALAAMQALDLRRLRRDARVVLIGRQGLYHNATFWPHQDANPRLQDVRLENAPPTLVFDYLVRQPRGGPYIKTVRIPVPPGREAEARNVLAQLLRAIVK